MDAILIEGIQVPAALGVSAGERALRRPVRIDLELLRDLSGSGRSDELDDTVDYAQVYETVVKVAGGREHRLVEALAERIVEALFENFPIDGVRVEIRKIAPVAGSLQHAGVRLQRSRPSRPRSGDPAASRPGDS